MYILKLCAKVVKIERKTKKKLLFLLFALPRCANSDRWHPERILPSRRIFRGVNECLRCSLRAFAPFSLNIYAVLSNACVIRYFRCRPLHLKSSGKGTTFPLRFSNTLQNIFLFFQSRLSPVVILVIWSFGQNQFQGVKIRHYIINILYLYIVSK